jgi:KaiC/GvpD/RAD55 family RecA-like ATPase
MRDRDDDTPGFSSRPVTTAGRFAGRRAELRKAIHALADPSAILAIVGPPGSGKTSLANQIRAVAEGDYRIAGRARISDALAAGPGRFRVAQVTPQGPIADIARLIALIGSCPPVRTLLPPCWAPPPSDGTDSAEPIAAFARQVEYGARRLASRRGDLAGLLLIIDRVDYVLHRAGLADLIRCLTGESVKVVMSGVAESGRGLFDAPERIARALRGGAIHLGALRPEEVAELVADAEESLGWIRFHPFAVARIVERTAGIPLLVQRHGAACVAAAQRMGRRIVDDEVLEVAIRDGDTPRFAGGSGGPPGRQTASHPAFASAQRLPA